MEYSMLEKKYLRSVPLPVDLKKEHIYEALSKTQDLLQLIKEKTGINLADIIQANNFSGMISNIFTKMLGDISVYKEFSEQRYPDLMHEKKNIGLEVKASNKPWKGGEGHNGHSGWHIIVCYEKDENGKIEFIQAEIANLNGYETNKPDWQYLGSKRNENNSQRTETYVTNAVGTAKLRDGSVYLNDEKVSITPAMKKARAKVKDFPIPKHSPLYK